MQGVRQLLNKGEAVFKAGSFHLSLLLLAQVLRTIVFSPTTLLEPVVLTQQGGQAGVKQTGSATAILYDACPASTSALRASQRNVGAEGWTRPHLSIKTEY